MNQKFQTTSRPHNLLGLFMGLRVRATFGLIWFVTGVVNTPHRYIGLVIFIGLLFLAYLLISIRRLRNSYPALIEQKTKLPLGFWVQTIVEVVLIVAAIIICRQTGHQEFIAPTIAMVVGLHFIALAKVLKNRSYVSMGLVLVIASSLIIILGSHLHFSLSLFIMATGLTSALIIWGFASYSLYATKNMIT